MNKAILILAILFTGCCVESKIQTNKEESKTTDKAFVLKSGYWNMSYTLNIIIIDNCEYLFGCFGGADGYVLTHKGNCNNPIHIYNKEKDE